MGFELSPAVQRRVATLFPPQQRAEAAQLLVAECGANLPFADTLGPAGVERVRAAVLKLSGGDLEELGSAIDLAQSDWRDALCGAGFGEELSSHLRWLNEP